MIGCEQLTVKFKNNIVLSNVSFRAEQHEIVGVIGPPESGKSVLLKTLAGLFQPIQGHVLAGSMRLEAATPQDQRLWRQRIGMSFQNDALFDAMSVLDNVAFPLQRRGVSETQALARAKVSLAEVDLEAAQNKYPAELSGGMRKRVGIARATVIEPEVGLFDEPISGLDPQTAHRIIELIHRLTKQLMMTTVIVSNDLPVLLPVLDRVVMLHQGTVVFNGPVNQLKQAEQRLVVQFVTGSDQGPL